jgi:hypothetical protein
MQRDWKDFKSLYSNISGAREAFANACETVFRKKYQGNNVQQVSVKHGDGGIDIFVGNLGQDAIDVFQCKYFVDELAQAQKNQIQNSFKTAINSKEYKMESWTLCLPRILNLDELKWWGGWKKARETQFNLPNDFIRFINGNALIDLMKENKVYDSIFMIEDSKNISEILEILKPNNANNCHLKIHSKGELSRLQNFFSQKGLNINNDLQEDLIKVFFELALNSFNYGNAKSCGIEVNSNQIAFVEDGNPFNPLIERPFMKIGAGLLYLKLISAKYNEVCKFSFQKKSSKNSTNKVILDFKKPITDKNLVDPCYHFVPNVFLIGATFEDLSFNICEDCKTITFDFTKAIVPLSSVYFLIKFLLKITDKFKPILILIFNNKEIVDYTINTILVSFESDIIRRLVVRQSKAD